MAETRSRWSHARGRRHLVRSQVLHPLSYKGLVSQGGLEPPASDLSDPRSDLLSYSDVAEGAGFEPAPDNAGLS